MKATLLLLKLRESNNWIWKTFPWHFFSFSFPLVVDSRMEFHCRTNVKVQFGISFKYYYGILTMSWFNSVHSAPLRYQPKSIRITYNGVRSRTRPLYSRKEHKYSKWTFFRRWKKTYTRKEIYDWSMPLWRMGRWKPNNRIEANIKCHILSYL